MSDSNFYSNLAQSNLAAANQFSWNQIGAIADSKRSWKYQQKAMELQHQYNIDAAQRTFDYNLQAWNLENEYNSPSAQMERYKAAGLNPLLIYGNQQNGASFGSSPVSGSSLPSVQTGRSSSFDLIAGINALQNIMMNKKQMDLIQANVNRTNAAASEIAERTLGYKSQRDLRTFDYQFKLDAKDNMLKRMEGQANYFDAMSKWNKMRYEQYRDTGIDISDSIWARLLARLVDKLGFSISGAVDGATKLLKSW